MRLPYLSSWDNTPIVVTLTSDGIDENGAQEQLGTYSGKCNFVGKSKTVVDKDGRQVNIGGYLTIKGDIFPDVALIAGFVEIDGATRNIFNSNKVRNPDGSVNHTRLELL